MRQIDSIPDRTLGTNPGGLIKSHPLVLSQTDFFTNANAPLKTKEGKVTYVLQSSSANVFKSVIAESTTIPAIDGS